MRSLNLLFLAAITLAFFLVGCNSDDGPSPLKVNFNNSDLGVGTTAEVSIVFSRAVKNDGAVSISVISSSLTYGTDADYYTDPEMVNNVIEVPFAAGDESVSFTIFPGSTIDISQNPTITLTVEENEEFKLGESVSATVNFADFTASKGILELNGGGADLPNQSFVDLSKIQQTIVDKSSWDLGFNTTSGEFNVILNSSAKVMARSIDETDIDLVVAADTLGFGAEMEVSLYDFGLMDAYTWIDNHNGDLLDLAIDEVSSTDAENPVFIIKRDGEGRNWKKVRFLQDGDNYEVQYADIASDAHSTITITKDQAFNFNFLDLDDGQVTIQPETEEWDFMYGSYSVRANYGILMPIGFNDYVVLNRKFVSATKINFSDGDDPAYLDVTYDDFGSDDLSSVTLLSDDISAIGASWRTLVEFSLVLDENVYYVIEDNQGNTYKLIFTSLTSDQNERGYPSISFERID